MDVIPRGLLDQLVGGVSMLQNESSGEVDPTAAGVGGGGDGGFTGQAGWVGDPAAREYDIYAVGYEGGQQAVVRISGIGPIMGDDHLDPDTLPAGNDYGGTYLGTWVEPAALSYEHTAFDGALIATTGRLAGTAAGAFIEGAMIGAGATVGAAGVGAIAGFVIGGFVSVGVYYLLQNDHPQAHYVPNPGADEEPDLSPMQQ